MTTRNEKAETQAIWSRRAGGVEIHAKGCRALNKATGRPLAVWIRVDEEGLQDLIERGYKVRYCRCTKAA